MAALTPYILPSILTNAPTGISWSTLPSNDANAQRAEQWEMCRRATSWIDSYCNQVLRAMVDVEEESGPGRVVTVDRHSGVARMRLRYWPVLEIISAKVATSALPRNWTPVAADHLDVSTRVPRIFSSPVIGGSAVGPSAIDIGQGYLNWIYGRNGFKVNVTYLNGWPHAGLAAAATISATSISVDDVTGYSLATPDKPILATIQDGANTEQVSVIGATQSGNQVAIGAFGPGLLLLDAGILFSHAGPVNGLPGVLVTTMPSVIQDAAIEHARVRALSRGGTAFTGPTLNSKPSGGMNNDPLSLAKEFLEPFRRVL